MSRYRKVDPRIWNDAKFRELSDLGKLLFFFLLTHPYMTALGAMRASLQGLAAEIGWSEKDFRKAFDEVKSKGMVMHDESASLIWLPNFIKYNPPESPNVVKSWVHSLELLPECALLTRVITTSVAFAKTMNKAFVEALPEDFTKTIANPEPEHEPELKPDKPSCAPAKAERRSVRDDSLSKKFLSFWTAYPRKKGKGDAEKAFRKLNPSDELLKQILQAIAQARSSAEWANDKYIPYPATWLNGRRWEDEAFLPVDTTTSSGKWWDTWPGIERRAKELNVEKIDGEHDHAFKVRVFEAAKKSGEKIVRAA